MERGLIDRQGPVFHGNLPAPGDAWQRTPGTGRLQNAAASADQVDHQDDQGDYEQNVNQTARYVKAESKQPHD